MSGAIRFRAGAIRSVGELLDETGATSIFLVTGRCSYAASGAEQVLEKQLRGKRVLRFSDFESNPQLPEVERAVELFRQNPANLILAVGGGSVLDMAKLIAILSVQGGSAADVVLGRRPIAENGQPVMAIPTTAGTGAEVTHFATVYVDQRKHSLAHPSMRPAYAIVDPELTYSLPPHTTAVTGLDAFSQAVESMWSVAASRETKDYSREAIRLALDHLHSAVHQPSPQARYAMSKASHLAGKAIDIAKTTAPHALSYTLTARFGVPHGHAVALTLGPLWIFNSDVSDRDAVPPRSARQVRDVMTELNALVGCPHAAASAKRIKRLIESLGLPTRLSDVGIRTAAERRRIADEVNVERLQTNPRRLTQASLREIVESIA